MTDATTEVTKAPFDATTDISGGLGAATSEFTQPTTDLSASTTPRDWFAGDGTLRAEHKLRAFTAYSYQSLKTDIARGNGEYLASFASLLGLPDERRAAFFQQMQQQFSALYAEHLTPTESLTRILAEAHAY